MEIFVTLFLLLPLAILFGSMLKNFLRNNPDRKVYIIGLVGVTIVLLFAGSEWVTGIGVFLLMVQLAFNILDTYEDMDFRYRFMKDLKDSPEKKAAENSTVPGNVEKDE